MFQALNLSMLSTLGLPLLIFFVKLNFISTPNSKTTVAADATENARVKEAVRTGFDDVEVAVGGKENHWDCDEVCFPNWFDYLESLYRSVKWPAGHTDLVNQTCLLFRFRQQHRTKDSLASGSTTCHWTDRISSTDQWARLLFSAMSTWMTLDRIARGKLRDSWSDVKKARRRI